MNSKKDCQQVLVLLAVVGQDKKGEDLFWCAPSVDRIHFYLPTGFDI